MGKTETLKRIKEAEALVAQMKKDAQEEKERILKDARRAELELQDALRKEADDRYEKVMAETRQVIAAEREMILEKGRREAKKVNDEGSSRIDDAAERLVVKFKGAVNA